MLYDWYISDTHFGHKNIIAYCNRPLDADRQMIQNWKDRVGNNDTVLHLGDFALPNWKIDTPSYYQDLIRQLPGKIYLVRGNHDHTKAIRELKRLGVEVLPQFFDTHYNILFSHKPQHLKNDRYLNLHGHIHSNKYPHYISQSKGRYRNISVEVIGYAPVTMEDIRNGRVGNCPEDVGVWPKSLVPEYQS